VERAALLYNASVGHSVAGAAAGAGAGAGAAPGAGVTATPGQTEPMDVDDDDLEAIDDDEDGDGRGKAEASSAARPSSASDPSTWSDEAKRSALAAVAEELWRSEVVQKVGLRQMLLLLATRRLHPTEGSLQQLCAAKVACGDHGWREAVLGGDVSYGAERRQRPDVQSSSANVPLPPFVYVVENVPYDVLPTWSSSGQHTSCKCKKTRTRFCNEACNGCRSQRAECGYLCGCAQTPSMCSNRALQRGLTKRLDLVHNADKGWGVFAREMIMKGEFVIEYVGEIISQAEMERREANCEEAWAYTFTIAGRGRDTSTGGNACYIDAHAIRNLAAFINFGCSPNLEVRSVPSLSGDKRMPRIAFYAKQDIKAGQELTYLRDSSATSKKAWSHIQCRCESKQCRGFI